MRVGCSSISWRSFGGNLSLHNLCANPSSRSCKMSWLWPLAKKTMFGTLLGVTISNTFGSFAAMSGRSMQPTLNPMANETSSFFNRDYLLVDKWSTRGYRFKRGDVVILRSPVEPTVCMVKRLIALQGDWVTVPGTREVVYIPKGRCWVEGDNSSMSLDSKSFGPIPLALLKGKVTHVFWPPKRVCRVENKIPEGRISNVSNNI